MKERPILFSAPMVRAILDGRKTQTRRVVKPGWLPIVEEMMRVNGKWVWTTFEYDMTTPYGEPGDRLWVRETFCALRSYGERGELRDLIEGPLSEETDVAEYEYRADSEFTTDPDFKWRPSIHMPRWASRITLEITDVRVERLQDISEKDAHAEGVESDGGWEEPCGEGYADGFGYLNYRSEDEAFEFDTAKESFRSLWQSINGLNSWAENPWVWVVEFRRIR